MGIVVWEGFRDKCTCSTINRVRKKLGEYVGFFTNKVLNAFKKFLLFKMAILYLFSCLFECFYMALTDVWQKNPENPSRNGCILAFQCICIPSLIIEPRITFSKTARRFHWAMFQLVKSHKTSHRCVGLQPDMFIWSRPPLVKSMKRREGYRDVKNICFRRKRGSRTYPLREKKKSHSFQRGKCNLEITLWLCIKKKRSLLWANNFLTLFLSSLLWWQWSCLELFLY